MLLKTVFLCRLLAVPKSTASLITHTELGLGLIADQVSVAPLLLWIKIWNTPKAQLSQSVIADSLNVDNMNTILWLVYVKNTFRSGS